VAESLALHEGVYGRVALLRLRSGLVAHAHSDSHIVWWLGGAAAQTRIGTQVLRYSSAQACAVNAYEQHDLTLASDDGGAVFLAFYLSKDWLDRRSEVAGFPFAFSSLRIPIDSPMRSAAWQLLDMISRGEPAAAVESAVERLLETTILAAQSHSRARGARPTVRLLDCRLRRSIAMMRRHVEARLTIDEVAQQAKLSRARLFSLFRNQLNTTPQVFWSAIRLEEAIKRLIAGNASLADIAHDLGFSAASNFSRFFKEHTGVSPSEYRRAATGFNEGCRPPDGACC
jgi:AraC-like DNA-binding protein